MKASTYSIDIANVVKKFLVDDNWNFSFDEARGIFKFGLRIKGRLHNLMYLIDIKREEAIVYAVCPISADEEDNKMMMEMAEFLHWANWGLKNGCFEFDFKDGEIRFKSYIDCAGTLPSIEIINNSILCSAAMFEKYGVGIAAIIFAESYAEEAIAICEKKYMEELRKILAEAENPDLTEEKKDEVPESEKDSSEELPEVQMDLFSEKKTEAEE